jgi:hypothetical protein
VHILVRTTDPPPSPRPTCWPCQARRSLARRALAACSPPAATALASRRRRTRCTPPLAARRRRTHCPPPPHTLPAAAALAARRTRCPPPPHSLPAAARRCRPGPPLPVPRPRPCQGLASCLFAARSPLARVHCSSACRCTPPPGLGAVR